jgi:hypothetical protein
MVFAYVRSMNKESPNKSPKTITQEQKHLDELIGTFINAAKAKGWWSQVTAKDNKNFRYATIEVRRSDVTATFEMTCDDQIKLSGHRTSFMGMA